MIAILSAQIATSFRIFIDRHHILPPHDFDGFPLNPKVDEVLLRFVVEFVLVVYAAVGPKDDVIHKSLHFSPVGAMSYVDGNGKAAAVNFHRLIEGVD
jgi:hypothetical protein